MEAKEFRIDNYYFDDNNNPKQVDKMFFDNYYFDDIEPIPLTEEWLLKFNWHKKDKYWYNEDESFRIEFVKVGLSSINKEESIVIMFCIGFDNIDNGTSNWLFLNETDYVHKFQSMCYELGEELTIKE